MFLSGYLLLPLIKEHPVVRQKGHSQKGFWVFFARWFSCKNHNFLAFGACLPNFYQVCTRHKSKKWPTQILMILTKKVPESPQNDQKVAQKVAPKGGAFGEFLGGLSEYLFRVKCQCIISESSLRAK